MLLAGRLQPGSRINEVEVAAAIGVSRGIVREALRGLEQEGLLYAVPRHGVFVRKLSSDEALEISEVRLALEVTAARRLTQSLTDEARETLEQRYTALERLVDEPFPARVRADLAYHEAICECAGNTALLATWRSLMGAVTVMLVSVGPAHAETILDPSDHLPLLAAIESGDESAIEPAWREHFSTGLNHIVSHLDDGARHPGDSQRGSPTPDDSEVCA